MGGCGREGGSAHRKTGQEPERSSRVGKTRQSQRRHKCERHGWKSDGLVVRRAARCRVRAQSEGSPEGFLIARTEIRSVPEKNAMTDYQRLGDGCQFPTKDRAFAAVLNSVIRSASSQQTWYASPSRHFETGWHDRSSATMAARSRSMLAATITHSAFAKDGWERDGSSGLNVRGRF